MRPLDRRRLVLPDRHGHRRRGRHRGLGIDGLIGKGRGERRGHSGRTCIDHAQAVGAGRACAGGRLRQPHHFERYITVRVAIVGQDVDGQRLEDGTGGAVGIGDRFFVFGLACAEGRQRR